MLYSEHLQLAFDGVIIACSLESTSPGHQCAILASRPPPPYNKKKFKHILLIWLSVEVSWVKTEVPILYPSWPLLTLFSTLHCYLNHMHSSRNLPLKLNCHFPLTLSLCPFNLSRFSLILFLLFHSPHPIPIILFPIVPWCIVLSSDIPYSHYQNKWLSLPNAYCLMSSSDLVSFYSHF